MGIGYENADAQVARICARFACYQCGAVPELLDVTGLGDAEPSYAPGRWPAAASDHTHTTRPPTPVELAAAGHASLRKILEDS